MIDESPAGEEFKRGQRGKLDALLALAEAHDCRRVRLLGYFGEPSRSRCGPLRSNCDNCLDAARDLGRDRGGAQGAALHLPLPAAAAGHALRRRPPDRRAARQGDRQGGAVRPRVLSDLRHRRRPRARRSGAPCCASSIALGHLRTEGEYNTLGADRERARGAARRGALLLRMPSGGAGAGAAARQRAARRARTRPPRGRPRRRRPARASPRSRRGAPRWRASTTCRPTSSSTTRRWPRWRAAQPGSLDELARDQRRRREEARGLRARDPARAARRVTAAPAALSPRGARPTVSACIQADFPRGGDR